jgi:hypothetical protein
MIAGAFFGVSQLNPAANLDFQELVVFAPEGQSCQPILAIERLFC